jgi:RNA polymerase sigma factor (TIGR02999 family)
MSAHAAPDPRDHEVTRLLHDWAGGDQGALGRLIDLVYPELHRIAARHLRSERQGHTLQPTALVNEAFLRLAQRPDKQWNDRTHFFAVAARIVRNVLVDHARSRDAGKRGAGAMTVVLTESSAKVPALGVNLLDLDIALKELEQLDAQHSRIVELRYFAGLSIEETAAVVGVSESSVKRDWVLAKTWIRRRMDGGVPDGV